jgi:hypothetical protein
MSPRRVRLEARVFRGESVAFEACAGFRAGAVEPALCHCGWLAEDHRAEDPRAVDLRAGVPAPVAWRRTPLPVLAFARRAS